MRGKYSVFCVGNVSLSKKVIELFVILFVRVEIQTILKKR